MRLHANARTAIVIMECISAVRNQSLISCSISFPIYMFSQSFYIDSYVCKWVEAIICECLYNWNSLESWIQTKNKKKREKIKYVGKYCKKNGKRHSCIAKKNRSGYLCKLVVLRFALLTWRLILICNCKL